MNRTPERGSVSHDSAGSTTTSSLAAIGLFGALACQSGDEVRDFPCDPSSDRVGTYLTEYVSLSDCPPVAPVLARFDTGSGSEGACVLTAADRWSDHDCKLERSMICPLDSVEPGATFTLTMVSRQEDEDGTAITGTMSITVYDGAGFPQATCTYRVEATRQ